MTEELAAKLRTQSLTVEYVDVDSIQPNSYNPNRQTEEEFELLKSSIRADGITQPVIVDRETREVVDGEHRWRAAQALGYDRVPVVWVDMTPEERRIATLRHNRARGSEDFELAAAVMRDLEERGVADWATEELRIDQATWDNILKDADEPEVQSAPEVQAAIAADPNDTAAIADATRSAEKRITEEKIAQSREVVERERDVVRLDFSFTGEEGKIVKRVLGATAAAQLLALCRDELARREVVA